MPYDGNMEICEAVQVWRYVKQFKKDNTGITVLKKDGRSATSPQQKAEMLNAPPCSQKKTPKIYHS